MIDALLDTAILVDFLRGYPSAITWLASQRNLGVTSMVWLEIIEGAPDRRAQQAALRLLKSFEPQLSFKSSRKSEAFSSPILAQLAQKPY